MKRWTDDENALFLKLWNEGITIPQMAPHFPGRSVCSLKLRPAALDLPKRRPHDAWSSEEITYLCENSGILTHREMAKHLKRSAPAVRSRLIDLGLGGTSPVRFTNEDDIYIKKAYSIDLISVEDIAAHVKHSVGTTRQHILKLGLNRDARRQRLINRFGAVGRDMTKSVDEITAEIKGAEKAEVSSIRKEMAESRKQAIVRMKQALADGVNRRFAFQEAMLAGATLNDIGVSQDITRERVRQIVYAVKPVYKPKPPSERKPYKKPVFVSVEKHCKECGAPYMPSYFNSKYCEVCGPVVKKRQIKGRVALFKLERLSDRLTELNEKEFNYVIESATKRRRNDGEGPDTGGGNIGS